MLTNRTQQKIIEQKKRISNETSGDSHQFTGRTVNIEIWQLIFSGNFILQRNVFPNEPRVAARCVHNIVYPALKTKGYFPTAKTLADQS